MFIKEIKTQCSSKWISLKQAKFTDKNGDEGMWDYVERANNSKAVTIICRSDKGRYLLIKQPRIPINTYEIAFPAGLIDIGETIEQAALRELKEETGYTGSIKEISPYTPKSAGITNELTSIVFCQTSEDHGGRQELDGTEEIQFFWLDPFNFYSYIKNLDPNEIKVSNDLYCFMMGINNKEFID